MEKVGGLRQGLQLLFKTARQAPAARVHPVQESLSIAAAQATQPHWQPGFLTAREAQRLIPLFSALGSPCVTSDTDIDAEGQATHAVTYLQQSDRFRELFPRFLHAYPPPPSLARATRGARCVVHEGPARARLLTLHGCAARTQVARAHPVSRAPGQRAAAMGLGIEPRFCAGGGVSSLQARGGACSDGPLRQGQPRDCRRCPPACPARRAA